jgi:hypothetical protein
LKPAWDLATSVVRPFLKIQKRNNKKEGKKERKKERKRGKKGGCFN